MLGKVPSLNVSVTAGVMLYEIVRQRQNKTRIQEKQWIQTKRRCKMKFLRVLGVLCALLVQARAMDREAFTFTSYNLNVRVEPEQQRLAVRGKITLRNDSVAAEKPVTTDSSSLDWRSNRLDAKPVQFVSQPYTSDMIIPALFRRRW